MTTLVRLISQSFKFMTKSAPILSNSWLYVRILNYTFFSPRLIRKMWFAARQLTETLCVCPLLTQISLVIFMIENCPKIFGEDAVAVSYETSLSHPPGAKSSCSQNTAANIRNMKETKRGLSSCPAGKTCTPGYNALPGTPAAPLPCKGLLGVYTCSTTITYS